VFVPSIVCWATQRFHQLRNRIALLLAHTAPQAEDVEMQIVQHSVSVSVVGRQFIETQPVAQLEV